MRMKILNRLIMIWLPIKSTFIKLGCLMIFIFILSNGLSAQSQGISVDFFKILRSQKELAGFPLSETYKQIYRESDKTIYKFEYSQSDSYEFPDGILIKYSNDEFEYITSYTLGQQHYKYIVSKRYNIISTMEIYMSPWGGAVTHYINNKEILLHKVE